MDEALLKIYARIIERYRSSIEPGEEKTVYELRKMIDPYDPSIKKLLEKQEVKSAEQLVDLVKRITEEINETYVPITFWLNYSEILDIKACEPLQKAMLICSVVLNFTSDCYVRSRDDQLSVVFSYGGTSYVVDLKEKAVNPAVSTIDDLLKECDYHFNNNVYTEKELSEIE